MGKSLIPEGFVFESSQAPTQETTAGEAIFRNVTNPFEFGPEIKGAVAATVAKAAGGSDTQDLKWADLYKAAKQDEERALNISRQEHPITSAAAQILSDLWGVGKLSKAMGVTNNSVASVAKVGGATGALTGLGLTEDITDLPQVAKDVAVTGALGAVLSPVVEKGIGAVGIVANKAKNIVSKGKEDDLVSMVSKRVDPETAQKSLTEIKASPSSPESAGLDIQNPEFSKFMKDVIGSFPQSRAIAKDFAENRNLDAFNRINKDLDLISKNANADEYLKRLDDTQKALSSPLYQASETDATVIPRQDVLKSLFSKGVQYPPREEAIASLYQQLMDTKLYKKFLNEATLNDVDNLAPDSVAMLHKVRKRIDADTSSKYDSFGNPIDKDGIATNTKLRDKIDTIIREMTPNIKEADAIYSAFARRKAAVQLGMDYSTARADKIRVGIDNLIKDLPTGVNLTKEQVLEDYKVGVRKAIEQEVDKLIKYDGKNLPSDVEIKKIIQSKAKREKLATVFGDPKAAHSFLNQINREVIYNRAIKKLGLDKAANVAEKPDILRKVFSYLTNISTFQSPSAGIGAAKKFGEAAIIKSYPEITEENAIKLTEIFLSRKATIELLQKVVDSIKDPKQKDIARESILNIYPAIIGSLLGSSLKTENTEGN